MIRYSTTIYNVWMLVCIYTSTCNYAPTLDFLLETGTGATAVHQRVAAATTPSRSVACQLLAAMEADVSTAVGETAGAAEGKSAAA